MENNEANVELIEVLAFLAASEKVDSKEILSALKKLSSGTKEVEEINKLLSRGKGEEFKRIQSSFHESLLIDADKFHSQNAAGKLDRDYFEENLKGFPQNLPCGWYEGKKVEILSKFSSFSKDLAFLKNLPKDVPLIRGEITSELKSFHDKLLNSAYIWAGIEPEKLVNALWDYVDDDSRNILRELKQNLKGKRKSLEDQSGEEVKSSSKTLNVEDHDCYLSAFLAQETLSSVQLDRAMLWPDRDIIPLYRRLLSDETLKSKIEILLTMRFGDFARNYEDWNSFFDEHWKIHLNERKDAQAIVNSSPEFFMKIWCTRNGVDDSSLIDCLEKVCDEKGRDLSPEEFVKRWESQLSKTEKNVILGITEEPVNTPAKEPPIKLKEVLKKREVPAPKIEELQSIPAPEEILKESEEVQAKIETPVIPKKPSVWEEHLKPFLTENWFMMAGVILFVVGSGILSYVTWDKHWLFRYTLMPALLAFFTVSLAYLGRWIQNKDNQFKVTATILRGAAVQLLPVNFMTIALLSSDNSVSYKYLVVPLMSVTYLAVSWLGMKKLCGAVFEGFRGSLSRTIILLNLLVILAPLSSTFGLQDKQNLLLILGVGFYLGFGILAQSVYSFTKSSLSEDLVKDKSTLWFFGISTAGTFLQVFGWVHSQIRYLPQEYTYAPMLIMTAALILLVERKAAEILKKGQSLGSESFLGYSLIILGVLLSVSNEYIRVICCLLAGLVWFVQANQRKNIVHYYVCLSFFMAGIFCIGFIEIFPKEFFGCLGLFCALILEIGHRKFRNQRKFELARSCTGTQVVALLVTVISAILCHLNFATPPLMVFGYLTVSALLFMYRAYADDRLHWVHAAMFVAALTLPYIGCVDLERGTLEGNTLIFGLSMLSILWILSVRFSGFSLLKEARSTVLWFYGLLSVTVMIIRVVMERHAPVDPQWYMAFMDYTGPIIMSVVLAFATWYSRSLIPAFMASIIVIILFPELKANFRSTFEMVGFGSGLGSVASAFGLILVSFFLRQSPKMNGLSEGDRFLNKFLFPLRRYDHTLFTWPLMISVCFLLIKTGSFNFIRQLIHGGVSVKGAIALILGGISSWLLCIYYRKMKGHLAFHPGWFYIGLGFAFLFKKAFPQMNWSWPVLASLLSLQILHFISLRLENKHDWLRGLFIDRASFVLSKLSHLAGFFCIVSLVDGEQKFKILVLVLFMAGQFIWHSLKRKNFSYAVHLYLLVLSLLVDWGGDFPSALILPVTCMSIAFAVLHTAFEPNDKFFSNFGSLFKPMSIMATATLCLAAIVSLPLIHEKYEISNGLLLFVGAVLIPWARVHQSKFLLLWSMIIFYGAIHFNSNHELFNPLHLSLLGLAIALINSLCNWVLKKAPILVHGKQGILFLKSTENLWLVIPAALVALSSELLHLRSEWRGEQMQILTSYTAAVTGLVISLTMRKTVAYIATTVMFTVANVHFVRVFFGATLKEQGLSENHLLCLGIGMTLIISGIIKKLSSREEVKKYMSWSGVGLSCTVLVILVGNYFVHPNLESITLWRYAVTAVISLLAALYLRNAARHPVSDLKENSELLERLYHFGLSMTFWCVALMIPFLRNPQMAMAAFGIPALYLYIRAEAGFRVQSKEFKIYLNSAVLIIYVLMALYVFRSFVHMFFYPEVPVDSNYYHYNAPWIILYGIILFRSFALGASTLAPFYGGLAIVTGLFFSITASDSMSPFYNQVRAAWVAVISGHFWILVNQKKSPLRSLIQHISTLTDEQWKSLRQPWGHCLLAAVHIMSFAAIFYSLEEPLKIAPLVLGTATLSLHICIIRKSPLYGVLTGLELLAGIHAGFLIESYLKADYVVWVIVALWTSLLLVDQLLKSKIPAKTVSKAAAGLALLTFCHVIYHHPASHAGLAVVAVMSVLTLMTPIQGALKLDTERFIGILLLLAPTWLSYFIVADVPVLRYEYFQLIALPMAALIFFVTVSAVELVKVYHPSKALRINEFEGRLVNNFLEWIFRESEKIHFCGLWIASASFLFIQFQFKGTAYESRDLVAMIFLTAGMAFSWFKHGRKVDSWISYVMMYIAGLSTFAVIRHQLLLTSEVWKIEYDVWFSILVSITAAASKDWLENSPKKLKIPSLFVLFLIPLAALGWAHHNDMGTNYTLAIIGLNSLVYTFLGKDNKQSPYNFVAVGGFVAFSIIALWSKLEIHSLHSYVLPVGMGVLILLQLFHDRVSEQTRFRVRLFTLIAMISTAGFYAVIAEPRSLAFNLTMLTGCLMAMGFGAFLRVRLYLILGFAGLMTNIISIIVRIVLEMNKGGRMAVLGGLILLIGGILVFGNLYYKTNQDKVRGIISTWRRRFGVWE